MQDTTRSRSDKILWAASSACRQGEPDRETKPRSAGFRAIWLDAFFFPGLRMQNSTSIHPGDNNQST